MRRALFVAERGRGRTSPNPIVGAVVVSRDGVVVGQGAHIAAGTPHAEVHALREAGDLARGGTLYCTLEPCSHQGRTPPCAPQVADAGISRAVIAAIDPNPVVAGRGVEMLRARGVTVDVGLMQEEAERQNAPFRTWITKRRPHVTLKIAQSADGFVGQHGRRVALTGDAMDRLMHRQRAEIDAIAIGSGTLAADDPLLTPRGAFRERPLARVIFDWQLRCGGARRVYGTGAAGPISIFVTEEAARANRPVVSELTARQVNVIMLPRRDLARAVRFLSDTEITSLLVEGGPVLQEAFAAADLVDRVQTIVTPVALGTGIAVPSLAPLAGRLSPARVTAAGRDTLMEADVHRAD